ncbi:MAG: hypothetical protein COS99_04570 [Candidatus Omnitrophica bacterium CG07_land_8_20_14_0_80_42_15]|uniref:Uncharacterized protein n=1 Tax=Candidatus Aquitaenariimonas noxiae TaxID=1974741 RepID=A0A2J0KYV3_9BACT|nr:MAG: hypothetical protein COS99_04570 [Candidatus Omnitrophica bacterium CG07_land_8_20_14_0_80_42_15]
MNKVFNVGIILWILISVALVSSCVAFYIMKENEMEKRIILERKLETVTKEKDQLSEEIEVLKEAKTEAELKLALKEKDLQNLHEKFEMAKMENSLSVNEKSTLESEKAELEKERAALQAERSKITGDLLATQTSLAKVKEDFEQLQQAKEVLEQKLKDAMNSGVKLETIVVEPTGSTEFSKAESREAKEEISYAEKETKNTKEPEEAIEEGDIRGEVLAVNKEYEFLVINLGVSNGINEDSQILIYRESDLIAKGNIEKLYENISAVVVDNKDELRKVKIGDVVIAKLNKTAGR